MFKDYKSSLGRQIRASPLPISSATRKVYLETQLRYACKVSTNIDVEVKKKLFSEQYASILVQLFEESINPDTFEHMVVIGEEVGGGLFSFADNNKNPNSGLYLAYRECIQPFIGFQADFYLGAFQNPCNYDHVFKNGVKDTISVEGEKFIVTAKIGRASCRERV